MTSGRRLTCLAVVLGALCAPAVAGAEVEIRSVDAASYPRAQATIVTSKPSKLPPQLIENGVPASGVLAQNLGAARSICLAVDHSRSMRGAPLEQATAAASAFVSGKLPTDRICVTSFATEPLLLVPFTDVGAEARAALDGIKVDPIKGTTLYDDIVLASETLAEQDNRARIIIITTDGNETRSSATLPTRSRPRRRPRRPSMSLRSRAKRSRPARSGTLRSGREAGTSARRRRRPSGASTQSSRTS